MKTQYESKAKMKILKDVNPFSIDDTPDHLPNLHGIVIANGKRGSGKSQSLTNLIRMYKEHYKDDMRVIIVSTTAGSNYKLLSQLGVKREDIFSDPDDSIPEKLIKIAEDERDDFLEWEHLNQYYDEFIKNMKNPYFQDIKFIDEYMLNYYNPLTNQFERPKPKYQRYLRGKTPILMTFMDDLQQCKVLSTNKKALNMFLRHRHIGEMPPPRGGAVGMTLLVATQTFKSNGGLNKAIRNNCTQMLQFTCKDGSEIKQVAEAFSGEVDVDTFYQLYNEATDEPHSFLFIDLHYKKGIQPSGFRKNFDTYLIPQNNMSDNNNTDGDGETTIEREKATN